MAGVDFPNDELLSIGLHFANTVAWHASSAPVESLTSYETLVNWAENVGILRQDQAKQMQRRAKQHPDQAAEVLKQAISLREAIYRIFVASIQSQPARKADLALLNTALTTAMTKAHLSVATDGYCWEWDDTEALDRMLWAVARSTAELLTDPELLARVGQCADDRGCGWLFLDMSKNRSRRWCDMNDCGNRAKQRRHHQRIQLSHS